LLGFYNAPKEKTKIQKSHLCQILKDKNKNIIGYYYELVAGPISPEVPPWWA